MNNPEYHLDSLPSHFNLQWNSYIVFAPNETTIEEMKSSSNLNIIRNDEVRRNIVGMYALYNTFNQDEELYRASTREIFAMANSELININHPSPDDIKLLLQNQRMANTIRTNFANGRMRSIRNISNECENLMKAVRNYKER